MSKLMLGSMPTRVISPVIQPTHKKLNMRNALKFKAKLISLIAAGLFSAGFANGQTIYDLGRQY
jgi:hypothetical protein